MKVELLTKKQANDLLDELSQKRAHEMLYSMWLIRAFEEKAEQLYALGKLHGTMHLSIGQEATAIGASFAVRSRHDYLLNHHRGHGHCIAWGGDPNLMMAEFMGRETGYCRGRGGSMHIADVESNNLGANGIVAGGMPISVGVGLSIKMRQTDQACLVIFGDGASNEGAFHESINMASIWDLPVLFLCENNQYGMSMAINKALNIERIASRSASYGIPGVAVDGNDVLSVYAVVSAAAEHARRGDGPTLIESLTYRYRGHSKSDRQAYRTRDEVKEWQDKDPIPRFKTRLLAAKMIDDENYEHLKTQAYARIEESVVFSEGSPEPEIDSLMEGIYA